VELGDTPSQVSNLEQFPSSVEKLCGIAEVRADLETLHPILVAMRDGGRPT
jgi:hypothetical protein